jgi:hypothetical protein
MAFHGLVVAWSKVDFGYSFEWFVIRIASLGSGRVSRRLEVDSMMNYPHWASFGASPARAGQGVDSDGQSRIGLRDGLR